MTHILPKTNINLIIITLHNECTVAVGAITQNIFVKMLDYLHDPTSHFYKWYQKFSNLITNKDDINMRFQYLKSSLYFDQNPDTIKDYLKNIFKFVGEKNVTKSMNYDVSYRNTVPVQTGNGGEEFIIKYMIGVVKYVTNDINDSYRDRINDIVHDRLVYYIKCKTDIDYLERNSIRIPIDIAKIKSLRFELCYYMLMYLFHHEIEMYIYKENTDYTKNLLKHIESMIIEDYATMSERVTNNRNLSILQYARTQVFGGLNMANSDELRAKGQEVSYVEKRTINLINSEIRQMFKKLSDMNIKYQHSPSNNDDKVAQFRMDYLDVNITYVPPPRITIGDVRESNNIFRERSRITWNDVSGQLGLERRRVLLLEIPDNGQKYAIKISTDKYPLARAEAEIYMRFRDIMNDEKEPQRDIIEKHIIKSYYFGYVNYLDHPTMKIYLTDNFSIFTSETSNKELYEAIRGLLRMNKVNTFYYYVTENVLGEYVQLASVSLKSRQTKVCDLMIDVFKLLAYLNHNYDFIHWDLHSNNILVDEANFKKFKIFDFDHSEIRPRLETRPQLYPEVNAGTNENKSALIQTNINNEVLNDSLNDSRNGDSYLEKIYTNFMGANRTLRNDIGLIYDIYRIYTTFIDKNNGQCDNNVIFDGINTLTNKAIADIPSIYDTNHNYYVYLIVLTNKILISHYNGVSAIEWIRKSLKLEQPINLTGGTSYVTYLKYKQQYLNLNIT